MIAEISSSHWLDQYGSDTFQWQLHETTGGRKILHRPIGLVESSFDSDGRYYEGRADVLIQLQLEIVTSLSLDAIKDKIKLAWACLRCQHLMLQTRAVPLRDLQLSDARGLDDSSALHFGFDVAQTSDDAVRQAIEQITFLDEHYHTVNQPDFSVHCQNVARIVDPSTSLTKLFVLPIYRTSSGRAALQFVTVMGHQVVDGLTSTRWMRHFLDILNHTNDELLAKIAKSLDINTMISRLPPAQEAAYPQITGSRARQRWFWLLTRILRHVRRSLPEGFENPLKRHAGPKAPTSLSPTYSSVLDYSRVPPLNSFPCFAKVSVRDTERLHKLCRQANVSIGSGCFALAALTMMEMYERREPEIPLQDRKPFITGFPLDPRGFLSKKLEPDSLMLAFSDGIMLPFLPSHLPLDGRLRLVAKQAHRQLRVYQKRKTLQSETVIDPHYMGSRGGGRMLQIQYLNSLERSDTNRPAHLRQGINPQGAYPMRPNVNRATCGVSSVGRREVLIRQGLYDLEGGTKDFVADFIDMKAMVRPREGEFLIGVAGTDQGVHASVSVDGSAIDPALAAEWQGLFESVLNDAALTAKL
ncbi:hypothetical protein K431DRAFT_306283 [Polychaeton citri CBS 116435]|uniref:CoA-dependent acyltransferase n=1 Tax=Polychaeton citri CBS 116435 TaxID=1314669 RepID=A0A9P4Q069_9PEZI|nr:hypothetical protein K431DRAFT_306283 [Polychaeton citri CBS 116435]